MSAALRTAIYRTLIWLLYLPFIIYTLLQARRRNGDRRFIVQRLGLALPAAPKPQPIWIHAASVGETRIAMRLLGALLQHYPAIDIVVSTTTPESAELICGLNEPRVGHCYLCIDTGITIRRLVQRINATVLLVIETELWPNLYSACASHETPVVIVNARLSPRTLNTPTLYQRVVGDALQHCAAILARTQQDAEQYIALGAPQKRVQTIGNLKFNTAGSKSTSPLAELAELDYWLAASTHAPEERQLAELLAQQPDRSLLVIAPRHPARSAEIERQIMGCGLSLAVRSRGEIPDASTRVYLADTTGEMDALIAGASIVFVGGSLCDNVGGHNLLEPAMHGKPVLTGASLYNFHEEAELLRSFNALVQVEGADELAAKVDELMNDESRCSELGRKALDAVLSQQDCLGEYLETIDRYL